MYAVTNLNVKNSRQINNFIAPLMWQKFVFMNQ